MRTLDLCDSCANALPLRPYRASCVNLLKSGYFLRAYLQNEVGQHRPISLPAPLPPTLVFTFLTRVTRSLAVAKVSPPCFCRSKTISPQCKNKRLLRQYVVFVYIYRACGQVFCRDCTKQKTRLPQFGYLTPERVCDHCFEQHNRIRQEEEVSLYLF